MEQTEFYRNNIDLQGQYTLIETDSLFYRKDDSVILIDEDQYFQCNYNEQLFRFEGYDIVEIPIDEEE